MAPQSCVIPVPQDAGAAAPRWARYVADAAWVLHNYDVRTDSLTFAHVPREAQRQAVFLDPRFLAKAPKSEAIAVADLPEAQIRDDAGPLHFIFHTGFCCSTLLTRALDIPGVSMGLKEPAVLAWFAEYWSQSRRTPGAFSALSVTLDLLSRPLERGETQIVKPSNVANHVIPQFLHARNDARALVLYSSLDAFLRAIARRSQDGRAFARQVFHQFAPVIPLDTGFSDEDVLLQTDLQIAAQAWLMQASFMEQVAKRFGPSRVRVLNSETFLADKARTLEAVGEFFGLALKEQSWAEIAAGPVFGEHAKEYGRAFDADAHRQQQQDAAAAHGHELAMARDWARAVAQRCNAPLTLEENLFP